MTAGRIFFPGMMPARDADGALVGRAKAFIYENETDTPASLYTSTALSTEHPNPVIANSAGVWPAMYADTTDEFTVYITDEDGAPLAGPWDGVSPSVDAALASADLAASYAAQVEAALATALSYESTQGTSTTSLTPGSGAKTLTIAETGKAFQEGMTVCVADQDTPTNQMSGVITAWDSGTRSMTVTVPANSYAGSGTISAWNIFPTGTGAVQTVAGLAGAITATALKTALSLVKADVGLGDVDNVSVLGKQGIWIPAGAMIQRITTGPSLGQAETTTNRIMRRSLDFDASTIEVAQFTLRMPKSWDEGTITFVPVWSHASTTTNFKVSWGLQAAAISDDEALDVALGTAQYSNDTGGTTDDIYVGPESSAITVAGTPAAEDLVVFQVIRKADDAVNDTLAVDARLHGITIYITNNAGSDD